jgi:hypothetical protein
MYNGQNPYVDAIRNNIQHLVRILKSGDWRLLRRSPPCFVGESSAAQNIETMVQTLLAEIPLRHAVAPGLISA